MNNLSDEPKKDSGEEASAQMKIKPSASRRKKLSRKALQKKLAQYTDKEKKIAQVFYFILVGLLLWNLIGVVWAVLDYIQPQGKWQNFLEYPLGVQIAVLGLMVGLVFFFLIVFAVLYKKGKLALLSSMFKVRQQAEFQSKEESLVAKIITAGILLSILVVTAGLVIALLELAITGGTGSSIFGILTGLSGGLLFLSIGLIVTAFVGLAVGFIALWNNGYNFFLNRFFAVYDDDLDED